MRQLDLVCATTTFVTGVTRIPTTTMIDDELDDENYSFTLVPSHELLFTHGIIGKVGVVDKDYIKKRIDVAVRPMHMPAIFLFIWILMLWSGVSLFWCVLYAAMCVICYDIAIVPKGTKLGTLVPTAGVDPGIIRYKQDGTVHKVTVLDMARKAGFGSTIF